MACQGSAKRACVEYDVNDYVTGYDLQQATRLAYEGDIEAVDAFLRSRPAFKSQLGAHILLRAAERGYVLLVAHLLTDEGVNRNYVALADGRNAFSAFLQAAQWGHAPVVTVLLADERVDPNKSWGPWDMTALVLAAMHGFVLVVAVLLADERVDPNMPRYGGTTALMSATFAGHVQVVMLLLADERVNPNMASESGVTALIDAVRWRKPQVVKMLLADERVNPNLKDNTRASLLLIAVRSGDHLVVSILLRDCRVAISMKAHNAIVRNTEEEISWVTPGIYLLVWSRLYPESNPFSSDLIAEIASFV